MYKIKIFNFYINAIQKKRSCFIRFVSLKLHNVAITQKKTIIETIIKINCKIIRDVNLL